MRLPNYDLNLGSRNTDNDNYIVKWPFSMIIIGKSGYGKTNLLIHMILSCRFRNKFDRIYYFDLTSISGKFNILNIYG